MRTKDYSKIEWRRGIKLIRQFLDLDQGAMARRLALSRSYLCQLESGKVSVAAISVISAYAAVLDIPLSTLVRFFEDPLEEHAATPHEFQMRVALNTFVKNRKDVSQLLEDKGGL